MTKPPPDPAKSQSPPAPSSADEAPPAVRVTAAKCVRCGAPVQPRFRPFCSQRCADVDLGQWASGGYRIPTAAPAAEPDDDDTR